MAFDYQPYEHVMEQLRSLTPEQLGLQRGRIRGWTCPFCGSGTGHHGTGALDYDQSQGLFYCFSCRASGDVLSLLAALQGWKDEDRGVLVRRAAELYGFDLPPASGEERRRWQQSTSGVDYTLLRDRLRTAHDLLFPQTVVLEEARFRQIHPPADYPEAQQAQDRRLLAGEKLLERLQALGLEDRELLQRHGLGCDERGRLLIPDEPRTARSCLILDLPEAECEPACLPVMTSVSNLPVRPFNASVLQRARRVFVTLRPLDALHLMQLGEAALAVPQAQALADLYRQLRSSGFAGQLLLCLGQRSSDLQAAERIRADLTGAPLTLIDFTPRLFAQAGVPDITALVRVRGLTACRDLLGDLLCELPDPLPASQAWGSVQTLMPPPSPPSETAGQSAAGQNAADSHEAPSASPSSATAEGQGSSAPEESVVQADDPAAWDYDLPRPRFVAAEDQLPQLETDEQQGFATAFIRDFMEGQRRLAEADIIATGLPRLDQVLGGRGLMPGALYVLCATPGAGKTALAWQLATAIQRGGRWLRPGTSVEYVSEGHDVLMFSLEIARSDLGARLVSRLSYELACEQACDQHRRPSEALYSAYTALDALQQRHDCVYMGGGRVLQLSPQQQQQRFDIFRSACDRLALETQRLCIFDRDRCPEGLCLEAIEAAVVRHQERFGRTPVVVVDYMQIITQNPPQRPAFPRWSQGVVRHISTQQPDRYAQSLFSHALRGTQTLSDKSLLDQVATGLRALAQRHQTPVLAISSVNRSSYGARRLTIGSLKESGMIEYAADVIMALQPWQVQIEDVDATRKKRAAKARSARSRRSEEQGGELNEMDSEIVYYTQEQTAEAMSLLPVRLLTCELLKNRWGGLSGVLLGYDARCSFFTDAGFVGRQYSDYYRMKLQHLLSGSDADLNLRPLVAVDEGGRACRDDDRPHGDDGGGTGGSPYAGGGGSGAGSPYAADDSSAASAASVGAAAAGHTQPPAGTKDGSALPSAVTDLASMALDALVTCMQRQDRQAGQGNLNRHVPQWRWQALGDLMRQTASEAADDLNAARRELAREDLQQLCGLLERPGYAHLQPYAGELVRRIRQHLASSDAVTAVVADDNVQTVSPMVSPASVQAAEAPDAETAGLCGPAPYDGCEDDPGLDSHSDGVPAEVRDVT